MLNSNIPVDVSRWKSRLDECSRKIKYGTDEQMRDRDGRPLWDVIILARAPEFKGSEKIKVVVASETDPAAGIELDAPVKLENLAVSFGVLESGKSWSKFTATKISPAK
ncbi:hypothetical protein FIC87_11225 [Eggerthella lenta]|uniref:Uncharacterized protein n=1 Tax=Eggerthella lenta TaxID=84112 RepID=A0A5C5BTB4_EGGLN|nr:hypothetical protein [Eggerthella lenta]TNU89457.1 hypothetical protein FIC87_11225 [Eggerthella lenta]